MTVRVGVLGGGNVGGPLIELIAAQSAEIRNRTGLRLEVTRIAVRDLTKARAVALPAGLLTTDPRSIVDDPEIDVIVEVIGGEEPAGSLLESEDVARTSLDVMISAHTGHIIDVRKDDPMAIDPVEADLPST